MPPTIFQALKFFLSPVWSSALKREALPLPRKPEAIIMTTIHSTHRHVSGFLPALPLTLAFALILALSLALANPQSAHARPEGNFTGPSVNQGGFSGPGPALSTVVNAQSQADDTWVTLRGHILQHNGDKRYVFSDATGKIDVKIGRKAWNGVNIGPDDLVEIRGEVDRDWRDLHIDVKQVLKAQ